MRGTIRIAGMKSRKIGPLEHKRSGGLAIIKTNTPPGKGRVSKKLIFKELNVSFAAITIGALGTGSLHKGGPVILLLRSNCPLGIALYAPYHAAQAHTA